MLRFSFFALKIRKNIISIDTFFAKWYSVQVTENWGSIEVRSVGYLSTAKETGFPVEGKGQAAEEVPLPVRFTLGRQKDFLRTVTKVERYHSGILSCRECWIYSMIHGFFVS